MASNKHFAVDLLSLEVEETAGPTLDEILRLANLPNSRNPYGGLIKHGKYLNSQGKKWLFDEQLANLDYEKGEDSSEVSQFR